MALTRIDFKNIPSSGIIPEDRLPGSAFAVGYAFSYTGTPSLESFNHTFSGKLVLHFRDATGVKYVVEIEETFNLFIFPLAPGLVLYTWNWSPNQEKISGRKGESPDAAPMTTLGLGSFGVDPAEGSGTTNYEVIIDSRFYSGIFTEPLEIGDSVKIKFHNLSAGYVVSRASLSLAIERGNAGLHLVRDSIVGTQWIFFIKDEAVHCDPSRRTETFSSKTAFLVHQDSCKYLQGFRYDATLWCVMNIRDNVRIAVSRSEGTGWEGFPVVATNFDLMAMELSERGDTFYGYGRVTATEIDSSKPQDQLLQQNDIARLILRLDKSGQWKEAARSKISAATTLPSKDIAALTLSGNTLYLSHQDGDVIRMYRSTDELASFQEIVTAGS